MLDAGFPDCGISSCLFIMELPQKQHWRQWRFQWREAIYDFIHTWLCFHSFLAITCLRCCDSIFLNAQSSFLLAKTLSPNSSSKLLRWHFFLFCIFFLVCFWFCGRTAQGKEQEILGGKRLKVFTIKHNTKDGQMAGGAQLPFSILWRSTFEAHLTLCKNTLLLTLRSTDI